LNAFDGVLVILILIEMVASNGLGGVGNIRSARTLRFFRVIRIIRAIRLYKLIALSKEDASTQTNWLADVGEDAAAAAGALPAPSLNPKSPLPPVGKVSKNKIMPQATAELPKPDSVEKPANAEEKKRRTLS